MDAKSECNELRREILTVTEKVHALKARIPAADLARLAGGPEPDRGEMIANVTLAYRHLEDARMRLGKAIQAFDGGVSVYDGPGRSAEPRALSQ